MFHHRHQQLVHPRSESKAVRFHLKEDSISLHSSTVPQFHTLFRSFIRIALIWRPVESPCPLSIVFPMWEGVEQNPLEIHSISQKSFLGVSLSDVCGELPTFHVREKWSKLPPSETQPASVETMQMCGQHLRQLSQEPLQPSVILCVWENMIYKGAPRPWMVLQLYMKK